MSLQQTTVHFLDWNRARIARCLDVLTPNQLWERPNGNSNSVGNQLLHLSGNLRQWVLSGLGGQPDVRRRAAEFAATEGATAVELLAELTDVIERCKTVVTRLTPTDLATERPVQAYRHDGTFILVHITEHLSYHTGQIIFWTKLLHDVDLNFYGGDDLDATA